MKCREAKIMLYWSRELPRNERKAVEAHLRTCKKCRAMLAELETLEHEFATLPTMKPGRDLLTGVFEQQPLQKNNTRRWCIPVPVIRLAVRTACIFILAFLMVVIPKLKPPSTISEDAERCQTGQFDQFYEQEMNGLHKKMRRVQALMRDKSYQTHNVVHITSTEKKLLGIRSKLNELKKRTEAETFPFQATSFQQRRKI